MIDYILNSMVMIVELTNIILCYTQILQKELCDKKIKIIMTYVGVAICSGTYTFYGGESWSIFIYMTIPCIAVSFIIRCEKLKTIMLFPCAYMLESAVCVICSYIVAIILDVPQLPLADNKEMEIIINSSFSVVVGLKYLSDRKKTMKRAYIILSNAVYVAITLGAVSFLFILSAVQSIGKNYNVPYNQTNLLGFLLSSVCMIFFILFIWLSRTIYKKNTYQHRHLEFA